MVDEFCPDEQVSWKKRLYQSRAGVSEVFMMTGPTRVDFHDGIQNNFFFNLKIWRSDEVVEDG